MLRTTYVHPGDGGEEEVHNSDSEMHNGDGCVDEDHTVGCGNEVDTADGGNVEVDLANMARSGCGRGGGRQIRQQEGWKMTDPSSLAMCRPPHRRIGPKLASPLPDWGIASSVDATVVSFSDR